MSTQARPVIGRTTNRVSTSRRKDLQADVEMNAPLAREGGQLQESDIGDGQALSLLRAPSIAVLAFWESRLGSNASQTTTCVSRRIT